MTTMNTCSLLLVAIATAILCTSSVVDASAPSPAPIYPDRPGYPCPWRKVARPEDPFIQSLGRWAVAQQPFMHFNKVESAKLQGVGSCTTLTHNWYYQLIIDASIRGDFTYMVVVYVVNFTQPQKVMSFDAIRPGYRPPPPAAN